MEIEEPPTTEQVKEAVSYLSEWMSKEPHLPKIDSYRLSVIYYHSKYSLAKAKEKIENYFSLWSKYPNLFRCRDPTSPELQLSRRALNVSVSDRLTSDGGSRLILMKWDPDPGIFNMTDFLKRTCMVFDMIILDKFTLCSYIMVVNCLNLHYQHFLKIAADIRVAAEITRKTHSERMIGIHLINAPTFTDLFVTTLRPFLPSKYMNRIFVHAPSNNSDILKWVDENVLPEDFGGRGPNSAEYDDWTQKKLEMYREWFKEQETVCSNESLRRKGGYQMEEMKGSFKKIDFD